MSAPKSTIVSQKDLNLLIRIIKDNWWVPVIILPIIYGIAQFYSYRLTDVYEVSTQLLVKVNDTYYNSNVVNEKSFYDYGSYVDNLNEQRILQSYDLIGDVIDKNLDAIQVSYYIVGKVKKKEEFTGMPYKIKVNTIRDDLYEQFIDLKIVSQEDYELYIGTGANQIVKKGKLNKPLVDLDLSIEIHKSSEYSNFSFASLKDVFYQVVFHSRDHLISTMQANLSIQNPDYTNILVINLKDYIPQRAAILLDTLNDVYKNARIQTKIDLNNRTIEYIDKQIDEISFSLNSIEDTMQSYKTRKDIIDLSWQQTDFLNKISGYDAAKTTLNLEIEALNDLEEYIIKDKDPQFLPPSVFITEKGGFMTTAVMDLYAKQIELNKLYNSTKEVNPNIVDLKNSIKKTKQDLLVYINNARIATTQKVKDVENQITNYIQGARQIPEKLRNVNSIQRKASVNEALYNFLLEKRANTKIAKASIIPDVKVVESPRATGVVEPNKPQIVKSFLSFGVILSIGIILLRAFILSKIKSIEHLKEITELPILGIIPRIKLNEGIIVHEKPNSQACESFRNLQTNLRYASIDNDSRSYLVTSYLPGEGKTFTSVNLAALLAKSGKKTVILELDLHKPRVYKAFNLNPQVTGITTYVVGNSTIEEIVKETKIDNLYAIFSGPVPPNPSEFVLSDRLRRLMEELKGKFDYIVVDTPPAGLLSDSLYLIQYVDSTIFVLNAPSSTKKVVKFVENIVQENKIKNLFLVLNGVTKSLKRYYYQGYGYGYGYGNKKANKQTN